MKPQRAWNAALLLVLYLSLFGLTTVLATENKPLSPVVVNRLLGVDWTKANDSQESEVPSLNVPAFVPDPAWPGEWPVTETEREVPYIFDRQDISGQTDYVELNVLFVVYPNTAAGMLYSDDIDRLEQYVTDHDEFLWRSSHLKLHPNTTFIVLNNYKDQSEFYSVQPPGPTDCGWLWPRDLDMDGESVETDLLASGVTDGEYDIINVYWAHNAGTIGPCSGGYYLGVNAFEFIHNTPLATGILGFQPGESFKHTPHPHEMIHGLDHMFDLVGYPDFFNPDYFVLTPARGGENRDFWGAFMRQWPANDWFALLEQWGTYQTATDADNDDVPDTGALPITEATLGSSTAAIDTDNDLLVDRDEATAGLYQASDLNNVDTDGDGLWDGQDAAPLYAISSFLLEGTRALDGNPDGWNLLTDDLMTADVPFNAKLYGNWDADYFYFMLIMDRFAQAEFRLDVDGNGQSTGRGNYIVSINPSTPDVITNFNQNDCSRKAVVNNLAKRNWPQCLFDDEGRQSVLPYIDYLDVTDIDRYAKPYHGGYLVQLAFPRETEALLVPAHASQIGLSVYYYDINHRGNAGVAQAFEYEDYVYPVLQSDNDPNEPNNSAPAAWPLQYGNMTGGAIGYPGDRDWFAFNGQAGDLIWADIDAVINDSLLESELCLFDSTLKKLATAGPDAQTGDVTMIYTLPAAGQYYLRLRDMRHPNNGGALYYYTLALEVADAHEPNNTTEQATPVDWTNLPSGLSISPPGDIDVFEFSVDHDMRLTVEIDSAPGSTLDPYICLIHSEGYTECTDDREADLDPSQAFWLTPGTYRLTVKDVSERGGGTAFNYNLVLNAFDDYEPNDEPAQATWLSYFWDVEANISPGDDVDYWRFTAFPDIETVVSLKARADGSQLDAELCLFDSEENEVSCSEGTGELDAEIRTTLPNSETYYLRVRDKRPGAGGISHFYNLSLDLTDPNEPNDTPTQATLLPLGSELLGVASGLDMDPSNDPDYFKFQTVSAQRLTLKVVGNLDAEIKLFGPDGITVLDYFYAFGDTLHFMEVPAGGTYYLLVMGYYYYGFRPYSIFLDEPVLASFGAAGTIDGVDYNASDILVHWQAADTWELLFDGSDIGFSGPLAAFEMIDSDNLLLVPSSSVTLEPIGNLNPQDIALLSIYSWGDETDGYLSLLFDGSDVGLLTAGESIDAVAVDPERRLVLSTSGALSVEDLAATKEDLLRFNSDSLGDETSGTWELFFDGSEVGLEGNNVTGVGLVPSSDSIYLLLKNEADLGNVSVDKDDIVRCDPVSLGNNTVCDWALEWDGATHGITGQKISSFSFGLSAIPASKGAIYISKEATQDTDQAFTFTGDLNEFTLYLWQAEYRDELAPGTYSITESVTIGWRLGELVCDDPDNGSIINLATRTVGIDLDRGESITCTFTNTPNTKPKAVDDTYYIVSGHDLEIGQPGIIGNDTDPTNDPLVATLVSNVAHGNLSLMSDGSFIYSPEAKFAGQDSFTYRVNDGELDSEPATVTIIIRNEWIALPVIIR